MPRIQTKFSLEIFLIFWTIYKHWFIGKNIIYFISLIVKKFNYSTFFSINQLCIIQPINDCICCIVQMTERMFRINFS